MIKHNNLQRRNTLFRKNYFGPQLFLMDYYFPKTFVHLSVIAEYVISAFIH